MWIRTTGRRIHRIRPCSRISFHHGPEKIPSCATALRCVPRRHRVICDRTRQGCGPPRQVPRPVAAVAMRCTKIPFGAPPPCLCCLRPRSSLIDPRPSTIPMGSCVWHRTKGAILAIFVGINESDTCPTSGPCSIPTFPGGTFIVPWNTPIALR